MKAAVLKIRTGDEKLRLGSERFLYGLKIAKLNHPGKPCDMQMPLYIIYIVGKIILNVSVDYKKLVKLLMRSCAKSYVVVT